MPTEHVFTAKLRWTGTQTADTPGLKSYTRDYVVETPGKPAVAGSAPAVYLGDDSRHSPEDLLLASLSACHLLAYLALAARAGIRVLAYSDTASGTLAMKDNRMRFVDALLRPVVRIERAAQLAEAQALHAKAHDQCFIASSVNFHVRHEALVTAE